MQYQRLVQMASRILISFVFFSCFSALLTQGQDAPDLGGFMPLDFAEQIFEEDASRIYPNQDEILWPIIQQAYEEIRSREFKNVRIHPETGEVAYEPYVFSDEVVVNIGAKFLNELVLADPEKGIYLPRREKLLQDFQDQLRKVAKDPFDPWVVQATDQAGRILDEIEDWDLRVNFSMEFKPNFESIDLQLNSGFDEVSEREAELVEVDHRIRMNPELHVKSITGILINPQKRGQVIELDLFPNYEETWALQGVEAEFGARIFGDIRQAHQRIRVEAPVLPEEPQDAEDYFERRPIQTNLRDQRIEDFDVQEFQERLFTPQKMRFVLNQLITDVLQNEAAGFFVDPNDPDLLPGDKAMQLAGDIGEEILAETELDVLVWVVATDDGEVEVKSGLDDPDGKTRQQIQQVLEGRVEGQTLLAQFSGDLGLKAEDFQLTYDQVQEDLVARADLPRRKITEWEVEYLGFPSVLLKDTDSDFVQAIVDNLDGVNLVESKSGVFVEMDVELPEFENPLTELEVRIPMTWDQSEGELPRPRFETESLSIQSPALNQLVLNEIALYADPNLGVPVRIDVRSDESWSDQIEKQFDHFLEHAYYLAERGDEVEDTFDIIESRVTEMYIQGVQGLQTHVQTSTLSFDVSIADFNPPSESISIDWFLENINNDDLSPTPPSALSQTHQDQLEKNPLHSFAVQVKLPRSLRIRLDNISTPDANVSFAEFSLRSDIEEPVAEVVFNVVEDSFGRQKVLPDRSNLSKLLSSYTLVRQPTVNDARPEVGNVDPKLNPEAKNWKIKGPIGRKADAVYDGAAQALDYASDRAQHAGSILEAISHGLGVGSDEVKSVGGGLKSAGRIYDQSVEEKEVIKKLNEQVEKQKAALEAQILKSVTKMINGDLVYTASELAQRVLDESDTLVVSDDFGFESSRAQLLMSELEFLRLLENNQLSQLSDQEIEEFAQARQDKDSVLVRASNGEIRVYKKTEDGLFVNEAASAESASTRLYEAFAREIGRIQTEIEGVPGRIPEVLSKVEAPLGEFIEEKGLNTQVTRVWNQLTSAVGETVSKLPESAAEAVEGNPSIEPVIEDGQIVDMSEFDKALLADYAAREFRQGLDENGDPVSPPNLSTVDEEARDAFGLVRETYVPAIEEAANSKIQDALRPELPTEKEVAAAIFEEPSQDEEQELPSIEICIPTHSGVPSADIELSQQLVGITAYLTDIDRQRPPVAQEENLLGKILAKDIRERSSEIKAMEGPDVPVGVGFVNVDAIQREIVRQLPTLEAQVNRLAKEAGPTNNSLKILVEEPKIAVEWVYKDERWQRQLTARLHLDITQDTRLIDGQPLERFVRNLDQGKIDEIIARLEKGRDNGKWEGSWVNEYFDTIIEQISHPDKRAQLTDEEVKDYAMYLIRRTRNAGDVFFLPNFFATLFTLGAGQVETGRAELSIPLRLDLTNKSDPEPGKFPHDLVDDQRLNEWFRSKPLDEFEDFYRDLSANERRAILIRLGPVERSQVHAMLQNRRGKMKRKFREDFEAIVRDEMAARSKLVGDEGYQIRVRPEIVEYFENKYQGNKDLVYFTDDPSRKNYGTKLAMRAVEENVAAFVQAIELETRFGLPLAEDHIRFKVGDISYSTGPGEVGEGGSVLFDIHAVKTDKVDEHPEQQSWHLPFEAETRVIPYLNRYFQRDYARSLENELVRQFNSQRAVADRVPGLQLSLSPRRQGSWLQQKEDGSLAFVATLTIDSDGEVSTEVENQPGVYRGFRVEFPVDFMVQRRRFGESSPEYDVPKIKLGRVQFSGVDSVDLSSEVLHFIEEMTEMDWQSIELERLEVGQKQWYE